MTSRTSVISSTSLKASSLVTRLHSKVDDLQAKQSVPVWVQVPVDSLGPGVPVPQLQGHVGVTEASEVGRAKSTSPNNLHRHEANILGLMEGLIQALHRMLEKHFSQDIRILA